MSIGRNVRVHVVVIVVVVIVIVRVVAGVLDFDLKVLDVERTAYARLSGIF